MKKDLIFRVLIVSAILTTTLSTSVQANPPDVYPQYELISVDGQNEKVLQIDYSQRISETFNLETPIAPKERSADAAWANSFCQQAQYQFATGYSQKQEEENAPWMIYSVTCFGVKQRFLFNALVETIGRFGNNLTLRDLDEQARRRISGRQFKSLTSYEQGASPAGSTPSNAGSAQR